MFLLISIIPVLTVGQYSANRSSAALKDTAAKQMQMAAVNAMDTIDRNLFERYGDVQAFAANPEARGTAAETTEIIDFLMATYGIYDLMLVAGLDGTIRAVNTIDGAGEAIDTRRLLGADVSGEEWFQVVASGNVPEGGTYYTDVERNATVGEVYGDDRLTLAFTAPIYDEAGQMIAIWHNQASFERVVGEIMDATVEEMTTEGFTTSETQVVRRDGVLIDDADPEALLSFNLVEAGLLAAEGAVGEPGSSGAVIETHKRRGVDQINGYAVSDGALGFAGYGWGALVRVEVDEAAAAAASLQSAIYVSVLISALIAAAIGVVYASRLAGPIRGVVERAKTVAAGDFDVDSLEIKRNDEIGELAYAFNDMTGILGVVGSQVEAIAARELSSPALQRAIPGQLGQLFNTMVDSLASTVGHMKQSSNQVGGAADQLTTISNDMDASAHRSAELATSVSASVEELSATLKEISNRAAEAAMATRHAVGASQDITTTIAELGESSEKIGEVIDVINTIAERTNLLALNATIEAARAGAAGKGFAVVAHEVKELASQTAVATATISERIGAMQQATRNAVTANTEIGHTVEKIDASSTAIASAVEEQSTTVNQIAGDVNNVALAVTDTKELALGTNAAATQLNEQAATLTEVVASFNS